MSSDPLGAVDGTNLYRYARNSPIVRHDPSGGQSIRDFPEPTIPSGQSQSVRDDFQQFDDALTSTAPGRGAAKNFEKRGDDLASLPGAIASLVEKEGVVGATGKLAAGAAVALAKLPFKAAKAQQDFYYNTAVAVATGDEQAAEAAGSNAVDVVLDTADLAPLKPGVGAAKAGGKGALSALSDFGRHVKEVFEQGIDTLQGGQLVAAGPRAAASKLDDVSPALSKGGSAGSPKSKGSGSAKPTESKAASEMPEPSPKNCRFGKCGEFADEMQQRLQERGLPGTRVEIRPPGKYYPLESKAHGKLGAPGGDHIVIQRGDTIYGNFRPKGVSAEQFWDDLVEGAFLRKHYVTAKEF